MKNFELLNTDNPPVIRNLNRSFPGILMQGDTLRIILDDIEELQKEVSVGDLESIKDISDVLQEKFVDILIHYEKTLKEHCIDIPYANSILPCKND